MPFPSLYTPTAWRQESASRKHGKISNRARVFIFFRVYLYDHTRNGENVPAPVVVEVRGACLRTFDPPAHECMHPGREAPPETVKTDKRGPFCDFVSGRKTCCDKRGDHKPREREL